MKKIFPPINASYVTGYLLALLFLIRAFFNGTLPLMDKTEARLPSSFQSLVVYFKLVDMWL